MNIDVSKFRKPSMEDGEIIIPIDPFIYLDNEKQRLPRKHSKHFDLQRDTNHFLSSVLSDLKLVPDSSKYMVQISVTKGNDTLGTGDLDNYSKAILDGITHSRMIWKDDGQVDHLIVRRFYDNSRTSWIQVKIKKM